MRTACKRPGWWRRLAADQSGASSVYVALSAGALFAAGALTVDLGRFYTLHTELQQAADAAALAGAAELDTRPGARARAATAAGGAFGSNVQTFAAGDAKVAVSGVTFLSSLKPDVAATDDANAYFVKATVANRSLDTSLARLAGGALDLATSASAVAGNTKTACNIPPLMVCNPYEGSAPSGETPFSGAAGQQILVKTKGSGSQWGPGTFGLLDPPGGSQGAQATATWLATGSTPACFGSKVSVRPGQANAVRTALNVRFDMYENPYFGDAAAKSNPALRPARNVTKGMYYTGNPCNPQPPDAGHPAKALPRDTCFTTGGCARFGDGVWDRAGYWTVNHGGTPPSSLQTRYQVYRWEIDNDQLSKPGGGGTTKERGAPACYSGGTTPNDNPDRRVLYLAVVNCIYHGVKGNDDDIQPIGFLKAFITEPTSSSGDTWLEIIEVADAKNSSVIHDLIQLYR